MPQQIVKVRVGWKLRVEAQRCYLKIGRVSSEYFAARPVLADNHNLGVDVTAGFCPGRDMVAFENAAMKIAYGGTAIEPNRLAQSGKFEESCWFYGIAISNSKQQAFH
jgi:hypothetical protein